MITDSTSQGLNRKTISDAFKIANREICLSRRLKMMLMEIEYGTFRKLVVSSAEKINTNTLVSKSDGNVFVETVMVNMERNQILRVIGLAVTIQSLLDVVGRGQIVSS